MILWSDIEVRQREHEQPIEQTHWTRVAPPSVTVLDRWQWRVMNKVGSWLVEAGCRLQTRVETAQQMVLASHMAMEAKSNSTQPCP